MDPRINEQWLDHRAAIEDQHPAHGVGPSARLVAAVTQGDVDARINDEWLDHRTVIEDEHPARGVGPSERLVTSVSPRGTNRPWIGKVVLALSSLVAGWLLGRKKKDKERS